MDTPSRQALREKFLEMKKYLTSCRIAQSKKLLLLLRERHHFIENSAIFSMQDLIDLEGGSLLKYLNQVAAVFEAHITKECEVTATNHQMVFASVSQIFLKFSINSIVLNCSPCFVVLNRVAEETGSCAKSAARPKCFSLFNTRQRLDVTSAERFSTKTASASHRIPAVVRNAKDDRCGP